MLSLKCITSDFFRDDEDNHDCRTVCLRAAMPFCLETSTFRKNPLNRPLRNRMCVCVCVCVECIDVFHDSNQRKNFLFSDAEYLLTGLATVSFTTRIDVVREVN